MKGAFKRIVTAILTREARYLLRRMQPTVVAVTGSVGKTSMKDAIYAAVRHHRAARKSEQSFNSELGVPLAVLGLPNAWNNPFGWIKNCIDGALLALFSREYPEVLILEAGVDRPGDMERLTAWLTPSIVVLTRLPDVPVHVEYFSSPEAVSAEKLTLVSALASEGTLVYNHDDAVITKYLPEVRQRTMGYGRYLPTDVTARDDQVVYRDNRPIGVQCSVEHEGESATVRTSGTIGLQTVYTLTGAVAVSRVLGVPLAEAAAGATELPLPPGRMRLLSGIKGTTIIDDSYNSSPIAAELALQTLRELKHAKRKIVVLGDMLELGRFSSSEHERIGTLVPETADALFTVGVRSRKTAEAALEHGLHESKIFQYDDAVRAGRELQGYVEPGDVILIKGSQGIRAERIVEEIMEDPTRAPELLARQSAAWKRR